MPIGCQCGHPPTRCALQKALLNQIRLDHIFDGFAFFADGCGEVEVTADGTSGSAELSTSDLEVEGADSAYEATVEIEGESVSTAGMAYGNTVITVVDTGQFEGDPTPDNAALLEEVALDFEAGFTAVTGETGAQVSVAMPSAIHTRSRGARAALASHSRA